MLLRRISNLIRGFLSLFISGVEKHSPEALLEIEKENLRKQIARYNDGLASHAGLCEGLMTRIGKLEAEDRDLRARATANLKAGNREAAGQYALRLQAIARELEESRRQLEQAEQTYRNLLQARDVAVAAARAKIEALKQSISDLKIKRALAELSEMASGMVTSMGSASDTLDRLHTMVEDERQKAAGRVRVARDTLSMADVHLKEAEQRALAEQALADFAAREGIALPAAAPTATTPAAPAKSMGPAPAREAPQAQG
jgi:phage shock protein A